MKKIERPKKLALARESLKRLDGAQLAQVGGGTLVTVSENSCRALTTCGFQSGWSIVVI